MSERALARVLRSSASKNPARIAVANATSALTYGALEEKASAVAATLRSRGVCPGDLVVLAANTTIRHIVNLLAVSLAGATFLALDENVPASRHERIMRQVGSRLIISAADGSMSEPRYGERAFPEDGSSVSRQASSRYADAAYVIYTSGSTGEPKGVIVPDSGLANLITEQVRIFELSPTDKILQWAPWSFDAAIFDVAMALGAGATLVLRENADKVPGESLRSLLTQGRINQITATPSALSVTDVPEAPWLHTVVFAGELLPSSVASRWLASERRVFNAYGPAEATIWTTVKEVKSAEEAAFAGWPISGAAIDIRNVSGEPVPPGSEGEVWISGKGVALGYVDNKQEEVRRFRAIEYARDHVERFYVTGDRGRISETGELVLSGRVDRQVKLHGARIELSEIEEMLARHPRVSSCAAVLIGESVEARIVAYVVPEQPYSLSRRELQPWLGGLLPGYCVPAEFRCVRALPLTSNGKLDYNALQVMPQALWRDPVSSLGSEESPACKALKEIWCEVLNIPSVDYDDDLFNIGGNSLRATKIVSRLHEVLGVQVSIPELFAARTIRSVSALIADRPHGGEPVVW